jgi:hypothetical protein
MMAATAVPARADAGRPADPPGFPAAEVARLRCPLSVMSTVYVEGFEDRRECQPDACTKTGAWLYQACTGIGVRWAGRESNPRATDYESAALTAELPARPFGG